MTKPLIDQAVDRFLGWKLPQDFNPDGGISFKPTYNDHLPEPPKNEPIGTNLFTAIQAKAMLEHVFGELIATLQAETEYLTECPSCGEGPSKTGFPRMDEDGCCACCGADCSILGTVEALKGKEGLDTALEFYANPTNYDEFGVPRIPHEGHPGCKVPDMGRIAKLALGRA